MAVSAKQVDLVMLVIDGDPLKSIYDIDVDKMDMIIKDGEEVVIDRLLEIDVPSRFKISSLCSKFKGVLADIRNMQ